MPRDRADTLAEVAERYRFTERWLRDFIRKHNIPVFHTGKQIRFDGLAIAALEEALRRPCHSVSNSEKTDRAPIRSRGPSRGSAYERLLNLESSLSRVKKPRRSKPDSSANSSTENVVVLGSMPRSRKPI